MRVWIIAAVAIAVFVVGCERKGKADKEELSDLAIRFLTAETYDEWSSCYEPETAEMLPKKDRWKKSPYGKEDIKVTKVEVLGDAAVMHLEIETKPSKLWAVRRKGKWLLTFGKASRPLHKSSLQAAREHARKAACYSNLKQIGFGCHRYARDHQGNFPPDLEALQDRYVSDLELFSCPSSPGKMSYIYISGLKNTGRADSILAYDLPRNHSGNGVNVLYLDGQVQWKDAEELEKILRASNP